jgi:hypothetical protein
MKITNRQLQNTIRVLAIPVLLVCAWSGCVLNQTVKYASGLGLSTGVVRGLRPLGFSMDEQKKQFIDTLPFCSTDEQNNLIKLAADGEISSADLAFVTAIPSFTQPSRAKLVELVTADSLISESENRGMDFLSGFPDDVKDRLISQFDLNGDGMEWLSYLSELPDSEFAEYAVRNMLCIQGDNRFTDIEKQFLADRDTFANELVGTYIAGLKDAELANEINRLPEFDSGGEMTVESVEGLEDIIYWTNNFPYNETFAKMNAEGLREKRAYCTPLQMLLAIFEYQEPDSEALTGLSEKYSLNNLIDLAWRNTKSPYYYGDLNKWGPLWTDYTTVLKRINSPYLVAEFMKDNIPYDIAALIRADDKPLTYRDAESVYKDKRGICADHAALAFEALTTNGYVYETDFEDNPDHATCRIVFYTEHVKVAHAACLVFENGRFYVINTGTLGTIKPGERLEGPFNTVEELATNTYREWDCYMLCGSNLFFRKRICR